MAVSRSRAERVRSSSTAMLHRDDRGADRDQGNLPTGHAAHHDRVDDR